MAFEQLRLALEDARTRLLADRASALAEYGLPSGLAFLALPLLRHFAAYADPFDAAGDLDQFVGRDDRKLLLPLLGGDLPAALRTLDPQSPLGQACQALVEAIGAPEQRAELGVLMTMHASSISGSTQTYIANQHNYAAPPDAALQRQELALIDYLRALQGSCSPLQISRIDAADSRYQRPMRLEQVYIGLHSERQVPLSESEQREQERQGQRRETRPLTALEALQAGQPPRLMLLGEPGSGKSTFVNHLALCLAGAALCERQPDEPQPADGWLAHLPRWSAGALLPVPVVLRDLAAFAPLSKAAKGSLALLKRFLKEQVLGAHVEALPLLADALTAGRALLLFDGLDEVVGDAVLGRVAQCIAAAADTYRRSPILVTCRVLDYQDNPQRHLSGFQVETLAPIDQEQIQTFVGAWYAELIATGRQTLGNAAALQQAVGARPELRALAGSPLLLTMMGVVHAGKGELPDARALLYAECIELRLLRWRQEPGQPDVLAQLQLPQFGADNLLRLMAQLGFTAYEQAARTAADTNRPADLSLDDVQRVLRETFAPYAGSNLVRRDELVSRVLHQIATRNGLLLKRSAEGGERYGFPHRSFQEFLAGSWISDQADYDRLCLERSPHIHWHEALRLMVGHQVLALRDRGRPLQLARDLLGRSPAEQALAGEMLNLVGYERAASYRPDYVAPGGLWGQARERLLALATQGQAPEVPATLRNRVGLALGTLCYGSLEALGKGAAPPLPDPRLLDVTVSDAPDGQCWRQIERGPFWYGDDRKGPLKQVELPYSYQIARYPVTNAEYARFVAAGGYQDQRWWTNEGWRFLQPGNHQFDDQSQPITLPRYWHNSLLNNPLQPVVGISWYEAAAYCRWLDAQLREANLLNDATEIRLPTALEWERAARHTDQRRYSWGDPAPTPEHANYDATGLGLPSSVGCFPLGQAECGALDMSGNVDEWTATLWEELEHQAARKDFTQDKTLLVRLKGYYIKIEHMCCGSRDWDNPGVRYVSLGFRLVRSARAPRIADSR